MLRIRSMMGAGMVLAMLLPTKIVIVLATLMTLPQFSLTLARHYGLIGDPLRKAHPVLRGRHAGQIDGDFCVFHIGLILNGDVPSKEMMDIGDAFEAMTRELEANPEKYGYLGSANYISANPRTDPFFVVQYWRSQEHLNANARERMAKHFPSMSWSSEAMKASAHGGFSHESFTVRAGEYEAIYVNCPQNLLGKAGRVVPATGRRRISRMELT